MPTYPFLSPEWIEEARRVREEFEDRAPPVPHAVKMNQIITDVPFGDGTIDAHLDTSDGRLVLELGHLSDPDVTITVDYTTARTIFIDGNPQAGMQAFMEGRIKVTGDMTKLLVMAQAPADPTAVEVQQRLKAITE